MFLFFYRNFDQKMCEINRTTNKTSTEIHSVILGAVLGSISLVTVVMNILVLYAVKTERKLHTVGNLYIISLSFADLIVGVAVMPLNIVYLLKDEWILGRNACLFWLSMDYVASTASIFSLFILCIDRYRSVQQPLKYLRYRTKTRASVMISGAWLLSAMWVIPILGWPNFANNHNSTSEEKERICETAFCKATWFKVLTAIVNFYIPSLLMLWFYAKIYKAVRKRYQHQKLINGSFQSFSDKKTLHHDEVQEKQKICLQRPDRDINTSVLKRSCVNACCSENLRYSHSKGTEAKFQPSSFDTPSKLFHRGGDSEIAKLSCFPLTIAQTQPGLDKVKRKYASVNKSSQNEQETCAQAHDLSETSDEHTFAEGASCKNDSDPPPEPASCAEGNPDDKDSAGLSYLRSTWQRLCSHSKQRMQGMHVNRERKAAKQLGCIMAAFMLCWIPYFVLFMVIAFCESCYNRHFHMFTIWLGYMNSTLNPFIYPFCNENFKKTFKKIFHMHS
uniref:Histamine H1 receptor n=1 Tax=Sphenodon punctatus TaxID=8508 RepID=A0A8D0G3K1_SPHPU